MLGKLVADPQVLAALFHTTRSLSPLVPRKWALFVLGRDAYDIFDEVDCYVLRYVAIRNRNFYDGVARWKAFIWFTTDEEMLLTTREMKEVDRSSFDRDARNKPLPYNGATFSLGSLMLVTLLIATCLGVWQAVPVLGIVLMSLSIPALLRTAYAVHGSAAIGRSVSVAEKIAVFFQSLGVVVGTGTAVSAAFVIGGFVVIAPALAAEQVLQLGGIGYLLGIVFGMMTSTGAAAVVGAIVIKAIWPVQHDNAAAARKTPNAFEIEGLTFKPRDRRR